MKHKKKLVNFPSASGFQLHPLLQRLHHGQKDDRTSLLRLLIPHDKELAVVLGVDLSVWANGERCVGRANGQIQKHLVH
jgi:hypothetical protein